MYYYKKTDASTSHVDVRWLLYACLYLIILKFLHALVTECNLTAVIFDWLPWVENIQLINQLLK